MTMPRGAIPTPRSQLAASEPYRPDANTELFVPSGTFPTPNHELAAARPYGSVGSAPESFIAWPTQLGPWQTDQVENSSWEEEAFAKACAEPHVAIPRDLILSTARECGSSNFAKFLRTHGFQMGARAYLDGVFNSVDWTNAADLNGAIANLGPVKIGVASASFSAHQGRVTPGTSGWAICDLPMSQPGDHCASLCGYGPLVAIIDHFEKHGINIKVPSDMPTGLCYAMFSWDSIGIIDQQSLINITGEAWVRNPTTIVKNLDSQGLV